MKINPIVIAAKAKGPEALYSRSRSIIQRYGFTSAQMDRALRRFSDVLHQFNCVATFPITAVTLKRHSKVITRFLGQNIEFAVHGYTHVDYTQLTPVMQLAHLKNARDIFIHAGITPMGFRSPYLCRETRLNESIAAAGFCYISNQPVHWDVLDRLALEPSACNNYDRALAFYDPWRSSERLSLPRLNAQLVEIPVSLPDDEILVERLSGTNGLVKETWLRILAQTHQRGELFTLQLHPERIALCADGISAVLAEARVMEPAVWCARLSEIAAWWKARIRTQVEITGTENGAIHMEICGPPELTILARAVQVDAPTVPWSAGYQQVKARVFTVHAPVRPFVGLSPIASPALGHFLREEGYITELSQDRHRFAYYFDQPEFAPESERQLLAEMEASSIPLVRLGRWPNGAQSALAITGDIDALTLWDYGLRLVGK